MDAVSLETLQTKKCLPCEGGVAPLSADAAKQWLTVIPKWTLSDDCKLISRKLNATNFLKAMKLLGQVAEVAEEQQHHPDLHLTGYRHVTIELTTHAIGGLSENDFIVAAQIEKLLAEDA
ncbi:MAG TPA: pterin-4-alpha-carbinolamine dehydratase [Planctomycetaceae bacterium]|nr:pterin-4-alpha-carbinolamine dehydratase [Planctomycetaceae bacterium]